MASWFLLVNNNVLLLLFALLGRDHPLFLGSFVGGLAVLVEGFVAIAVPAAGVAGSEKVNFSGSGVASDKEERVV